MTTKDMRIIRPARLEDMVAVHRLFNDVLAKTTATFEENPTTLESWVEIFYLKVAAHQAFLVTEEGSRLVGYATYGAFRKASGYRITAEHSVHVDEMFRGKGIGSQMLQALIQKASEHGIENLIGAIDADNESSLKLHEKLGFKKVGEMKNIARKFSRDLTLVLMLKALTKV